MKFDVLRLTVLTALFCSLSFEIFIGDNTLKLFGQRIFLNFCLKADSLTLKKNLKSLPNERIIFNYIRDVKNYKYFVD